MRYLSILFLVFIGCSTMTDRLEQSRAQHSVPPKTAGDTLTGEEFTAVATTANQGDAQATANDVRLDSLEPTVSGHTSSINNVTTIANQADAQASTNNSRLNSLESTVPGHTSSIDAMEAVEGIMRMASGTPSAGIVYLSDCSAITSGHCIDTDDNTIWRHDGASVVQIGSGSGGSGNEITDDDSRVTVDDAAGIVEVVIDGDQEIKISDGLTEITNGYVIARPMMTFDGRNFIIQVYDVGTSQWLDAFTFSNGDSTDPDPENQPRIVLGGNVVLMIGSIAAGHVWGNIITGNTTLSYNSINRLYQVANTSTTTLPDVGPAADDAKGGDHVKFYVKNAATLTLDCDDADIINRDGVVQAVGVTIVTPGTACIVECTATTNADWAGVNGWMCEANVALSQGS